MEAATAWQRDKAEEAARNAKKKKVESPTSDRTQKGRRDVDEKTHLAMKRFAGISAAALLKVDAKGLKLADHVRLIKEAGGTLRHTKVLELWNSYEEPHALPDASHLVIFI